MSIDPRNTENPATIGSVAQPTGRRCLVINADDLGFSQQVNAAIDLLQASANSAGNKQV
jgi:hypothetical protein